MKKYTVQFGDIEVTATREGIELISVSLGKELHYSQTTDSFIAIDEMHDRHLENAVLQLFNDVQFKSPWEIEVALQNPLYVEWTKRAEEDTLSDPAYMTDEDFEYEDLDEYDEELEDEDFWEDEDED